MSLDDAEPGPGGWACSDAPTPPTARARVGRWAELFTLFVVAPSLLALVMRGGLVFPAIWVLGAVAVWALLRDRGYDARELTGLSRLRSALPGVLLRGLIVAALLIAALALYRPENLFVLPRTRPRLWAMIMLLYPLLSAYPQEVAFRAFFRRRYRGLFGHELAYVVVNAAAFAYAHIILKQPGAILLCLIGGVPLAWAFERHRSVMGAWLEHTLYGCAAFTIGWGWMLYGGGLG